MASRKRTKSKQSIIKSLAEVNTNICPKTHVPISMLILIFIACLMIGAVWQKVMIGKLRTDIKDLRQQVTDLKEENEKEMVKKLNLLSDYRITQIAQKERNFELLPVERVLLTDEYYEKLKKAEKIINSM